MLLATALPLAREALSDVLLSLIAIGNVLVRLVLDTPSILDFGLQEEIQ